MKKTLKEFVDGMVDLHLVFDNLPEIGILVLNFNQQLISANQTALKYAKKIFSNQNSIIGKNIIDVFDERFEALANIVSETISNNRSVKNFTFDCKNKVLHSFLVSTAIIDNLKPTEKGVLVIFNDISELTQLKSSRNDSTKYGGLIGSSEKMQEVYTLIDTVKDFDATVLITGETGTGKEVVARAIHKAGNRSKKPFIPVQASALPESIIESEIFGHVKGAFTGASSDHPGRIKMANKGTLFLDEVGTFPETVQIKLLRFLQDKIIEPVGGTQNFPVDVRIISATNENLREMIGENTFREDLFYRLNIIEIQLPSLRERSEDIPLLIEHFITKLNERYNKSVQGVATSSLKFMIKYPWPGNVRELENAIEHAFVLAGGKLITVKHLPAHIRQWIQADKSNATIKEGEHLSEDKEIKKALISSEGNVGEAADSLGMHRTTFWRKMKELGLNKEEFKSNK